MPEIPAKEMSDMHTTSRPSASASRTLCGRKTIAFISGHMDITPEQFAQHYHTRLDEALSQGHHFVMGDAKGVDTTALAYLLTQSVTYPGVQERITVYLSRPGQLGRYQAMGVQTVCGSEPYDKRDPRARHLNRDARLTQASDYDVLYARTVDEEKAFFGKKWRQRVSATELNRLRRLEESCDNCNDGGPGLETGQPVGHVPKTGHTTDLS